MHATLTDFGLAKAMGATAVMGTRTMMAGSPGNQAPEQLRAESLEPHCDITLWMRHDCAVPGESYGQVLTHTKYSAKCL